RRGRSGLSAAAGQHDRSKAIGWMEKSQPHGRSAATRCQHPGKHERLIASTLVLEHRHERVDCSIRHLHGLSRQFIAKPGDGRDVSDALETLSSWSLPTLITRVTCGSQMGTITLMKPHSSKFSARGNQSARSLLFMDADLATPGETTLRLPISGSKSWLTRVRSAGLRQVKQVNNELWLLLSIFVLAVLLNTLLDSHRMLLGLYTLPTLFSAYVYGRRHATLTALSSVLVVCLITHFNPELFGHKAAVLPIGEKWFEITVWGGILLVNAYAMGTLYEHKQKNLQELRSTYNGVLMILSQFISKDKYTQNHSYRVSVYATKIASQMGMPTETVEDIRAAALIHDLGKLEVSREILYKAARLSAQEYNQVQQHVDLGVQMLKPV